METKFNQEDHDLIVAHGVKINHLCKSVDEIKKNMKAGFKEIGKKLDENTIGCSTNRTECVKTIDEKLSKKVDWIHLKVGGGVIVFMTSIIYAIFRYAGG